MAKHRPTHRPLSKAQLLARMPRAFRPKLDRSQLVDLGLVHITNLDNILAGTAETDVLWHYVGSILTWSKVAEALELGVDEMVQQRQVADRLVDRYRTTGRIGFTGADYQLAKLGMDVMDELARLVDRPTAIRAADWSEAKLQALARETTPERIAA